MYRYLIPIPALLLLAACLEPTQTSQGPKKKAPEKPAEPVTGRFAFHQMFASARSWAPDVQPLQIASIRLPEVKSEPGKSGAWQATFVSASLRRSRTYTYSVIEAGGNLHKGVFAGQDESYTGPRGVAKPFLVQAIKVDSDAAYRTAAAKSAEYMKKYPDKPIMYLMEYTDRFPDPTWRVIWGESVSTSNYSIVVDASTGDYRQTMR